jgi:transposase
VLPSTGSSGTSKAATTRRKTTISGTPEDGFARVVEALNALDERLARIEADLAALRKRKKRRIFKTREEREAFFARSAENERRLRERIALIEAELAAKRKPA